MSEPKSALTNVGLEFRPDSYEHIVEMLSFPSPCIKFLPTLAAL